MKKTICPPGTRDKQRRATRRYENLIADMLLTDELPSRKRKDDPTVYEPLHTFEAFNYER